MNRRRFIRGAGASLLVASPAIIRPASAFRTGYPTAALQAAYVARKWGLFLHFNTATFLDVENAPYGAASVFNPSAISISQWISTAVAAKVKYATLTVKHINGFCLWPSAATPYNITNASPFWTNSGNLNIANVFASSCRAAGIIPQFYFSVQTEDTVTQFFTQAQFRAFCEAQLTELLTQNGPIGAIWIDRAQTAFSGTAYPWDDPNQLLAFVRTLQQQCLVVNNSKTNTFADTNIIVYELSGNPPGGNTAPSEEVAPMRLDSNWFWKSSGNSCQDAPTIEAQLSLLNARGASYMLNAGPDNTGNIPANMVTVLTTVGASL